MVQNDLHDGRSLSIQDFFFLLLLYHERGCLCPQVVVAACLCRPVVVMGGVWVGVLVLVQAVLGLRAPSSHAL